jgi:hypothetical protein
MATTTYKVLGQVATAATTETDLYTVPAATQTVISTVTITNRSTSAAATYRVSVSVAGAATATKDYIIYDSNMPAAGFATLTLGITLGATDKIRVYASNANLSFSAFGSELA